MHFSERVIAFDFDDTLIGQKNSPLFHEFILSNPDKIYFIVTHRTRAEASTLFEELALESDLTDSHFEGVLTLPDRIRLEYDADQGLRRRAGMPLLQNIDPKLAFPGEINLMLWKGYVCQKISAKVLVDDLPWLQKLGCDKYGIRLFDSRRLTFL